MAEETCKLSRWQLLKQLLNNLTPDEFRNAMEQDGEAKVLDVRTRVEFDRESLQGAEHLDYFEEGFLDKLDCLDPEVTYLVYCRSGRRSLRVCTLMKNAGFSKVYNLDGGLVTWQEHFGS